MRRASVLVVAMALLLASCGGRGGGGDEDASGQTSSTDRSGNPIRPGEDWAAGVQGAGGSGSGGSGRSGSGGGGSGSGAGAGASATSTTQVLCKRPEPPDIDPSQAPPGFDPDAPLAEAQDDFPFTASVVPPKDDPGDTIEITTTAVYPSRILVVMLARFHDGESHGMEAAKFADAAGRAVFSGPIPRDAPQGLATITVSASTQDNKSAIETLDFTVTGDRCT